MSQAPDLGVELTIAQASACRDALLAHVMAHPGDVELDLGAVAEFDSSAAQWLVALHRNLDARGRRLRLTGCSDVVRDALRLLGLLWLAAGA